MGDVAGMRTNNLKRFEKKIYSQFGEDGITGEIINRLGVTNNFFIEFGIDRAIESNCKHLLLDCNWRGVMIEGVREWAEYAAGQFKDYPVDVVNSWITLENILSSFAEHEVPKEPDLLSVDLDSNDYWILKQILTIYRPRIIIHEYNGYYIPPKLWVMAYDPTRRWDGSSHFGASLQSYCNLLDARGYALLGCESHGFDAFHIKKELIEPSGFIALTAAESFISSPYPFREGPWVEV
jgi:hypothetical protein